MPAVTPVPRRSIPATDFCRSGKRSRQRWPASGSRSSAPTPRPSRPWATRSSSKKLALAAKVSTVPGYVGEIRDGGHAKSIAREIGYPVMVKASAGGGGKGLRIVHHEKDLAQAIQSSQNEAKASFGDDRLFIEKFVTEPRHIEIQVMGDKHGNVIHLGERECSIQRRHQKVIEEAPSPFLDEATRDAMGTQAVSLAKAVGYDSAGTVEFIVDAQRNFYFLEMNTRLQVEHPVTELITGLDLVELMIRSAAGEKLPLAQRDVKLNGWAVELRIYAEDPYRGFLPSTGRLVRYRPPAEGKHDHVTLRNDTGVYEGGEISIYYDPMIAKLCAHGPARLAAIDGMAGALDEFRIDGINHNIDFLAAIMHSPRFRDGRLSTGFIAEEYPDGFHGRALDEERSRRLAAAGVAAKIVRTERAGAISGALNGARAPEREYQVKLGERILSVTEARIDNGIFKAAIDGEAYEAGASWRPGDAVMRMKEGAATYAIQIARIAGGYRLRQGGTNIVAAVRDREAAELAALMPKKSAADTSKMLLCPMPGLVVSINVYEGQEVKAGETLAVIEAMKMENVLTAERDATVKKVNAKKGDSLALDDVILEFS